MGLGLNIRGPYIMVISKNVFTPLTPEALPMRLHALEL